MGLIVIRRGYRLLFPLLLSICALFGSAAFASAKQDANKPDESRLKPAYRLQRNGWVYVHLEGAPSDIGYQHGYLLAPEIEDGFRTVKLKDVHRTQREWEFYRQTAQNILWPHIDLEYQQELQGIADGLKAHGSTMDLWDVVALNAMEEIPDYYVPWLNRQEKRSQRARFESAGQLQRLRRHRLLDERPQAGDRP